MKYTEVAAGYLILSRDGRTHFVSSVESNVTVLGSIQNYKRHM